jgi:hypothetical protein
VGGKDKEGARKLQVDGSGEAVRDKERFLTNLLMKREERDQR